TITDQTSLDVIEGKNNSLLNILDLFTRQHITASQGYLIHLNDMNGKPKATWVFAEGQNTYISGQEYRYREYTSSPAPSHAVSSNYGKLDNTVPVIFPDGTVANKSIGVEYDVFVDFRENRSETTVAGVNTNVAGFLLGIIPGIVPLPLPALSYHEDKFRSA